MDEFNKFTLIQVFFIVIVPAIISAIPVLISALQQQKPKPKDKIDIKEQDSSAADKIANAYDKIVEDLQIRIDKMETRLTISENVRIAKDREWEIKQVKMEARLDRQRNRISYLEHGVQVLIDQLKSLGVEPNFILEDEKNEEGE